MPFINHIDVNETGTEAAAVTGIIFGATSVGNEPPVIPFIVDKPLFMQSRKRIRGRYFYRGSEYPNMIKPILLFRGI